jgi:TRAP transporter TAXI family solute receptor
MKVATFSRYAIGIVVVSVIIAGVAGYFIGSSVVPTVAPVTLTQIQTVVRTYTASVTVPVLLTPTTAPTTPTFTPPALTKPVTLRIATHTVGSSWYLMGSAIAAVVKDYLPPGSSVDVMTGPGTIGNIPLVSRGDAELAITMDSYVYYAIKGMPPFDKPYTNVAIVVNRLSPYFLLVAVPRDWARANNVKTFDDVVRMIKEGKRVVIVTSSVGGLDEYATRILLQLYGLTYDDVKKAGGDIIFGASEDYRVEVFKQGLAQVFSDVCTYKHPTWETLTAGTDIVVLPINKTVVEKFKEYGFSPYVVEKGTYKGVDTDILTAGIWACLIASTEVPPEVIYYVTKAIVENKDKLVSIFAGFEYFDVKRSYEAPVPLHRGAELYFRSAGFLR